MSTRIFELKCPRCKRESTHTTTSRDALVIKCGDCLMDDVEVVDLVIVRMTIMPGKEP